MDSPPKAQKKPEARSRITNGRELLPGVDGRGAWARRFRDLIELHLDDIGGAEAASSAERSIIRRASALEVELERLEAQFATAGEADADALDLYSRASNTMRRHLEAIGLQRRPRDVTPSLDQYLGGRADG
jgi:hypothetical protein